MSYELPEDLEELPLAGVALAAIGGAAATLATYRLARSVYLYGIVAVNTAAVINTTVGAAADVADADIDGTTNLISRATITFAIGTTAAGTKRVAMVSGPPILVAAGRSIVLRHTVAGTGTGTGAALIYALVRRAGRDQSEVNQ